jgi:hypothetical protein
MWSVDKLVNPNRVHVLETNISPFLDTASLMLHVELIYADTRAPVASVPGSAGQLLTPLVGDLTSFVQRMNTNSEDEAPDYRGVFAFNDLSVRKEGSYRLQFHLMEILGTESIYRGRIESDLFRVYQPKEFPGMQSSTRCTETLKKQGVKVRVKKAIRVPRGGAHVSTSQRFRLTWCQVKSVSSGTFPTHKGMNFYVQY